MFLISLSLQLLREFEFEFPSVVTPKFDTSAPFLLLFIYQSSSEDNNLIIHFLSIGAEFTGSASTIQYPSAHEKNLNLKCNSIVH